jgi:hypothetical protein
MATILHTIHWTVRPHAGDPVALLQAAVEPTDFSVTSFHSTNALGL